jgi:hypothetical protein
VQPVVRGKRGHGRHLLVGKPHCRPGALNHP